MMLNETKKARKMNSTDYKTILLAQKRSEKLFLWKVFLTFSERLCGSFPHKNQGIFTDHMTSDNPIFTNHPKFMQSIFNFIYFKLFHVLCGKMLKM